MAIKHINNLDIEPALNEIEDVDHAIFFIAGALPDYPHEIDKVGLGTILDCLSAKTKKAIEEIKEVAEF